MYIAIYYLYISIGENMITIVGFGNFGKLLHDIFTEYNIDHNIYDKDKGFGNLEECKKSQYIIMSIPVDQLEISLKEK